MSRSSRGEEAGTGTDRRRIILLVAAIIAAVVAVALIVNQVRGSDGADEDLDDTPSSSTGTDEGSGADADDGDADGGEEDDSDGADPDDGASGESLDVEEPEAGPIGDEEQERERVESSVDAVVDVTNQIATRSDGVTEGLDLVATGFVLGELENLAREQAELGYTQSGEAEIVSTELVSSDLEADPPHMVIAVCVDVSSITLTDAAGNDVSDLLYNPGHPVLHEYGADFIDEVWKVSTHEIPDEQTCSTPEES